MKPIHIIAGLGATAVVALAGWYMYMSQTPTYERTYDRSLPPGVAAAGGEEPAEAARPEAPAAPAAPAQPAAPAEPAPGAAAEEDAPPAGEAAPAEAAPE